VARPCASCTSPHHSEIDRKLKAGATYDDVSRWLRDKHDVSISSLAIGRHARHIGVERKRGQQPYSGDYLTLVRDRAAQAVASGEAKVSVQHGLQAQAMLDNRMKQAEDKRLVLIIAQVLGGGYVPDMIEGEYAEMPLLEPINPMENE
jgi:hypothetical protein